MWVGSKTLRVSESYFECLLCAYVLCGMVVGMRECGVCVVVCGVVCGMWCVVCSVCVLACVCVVARACVLVACVLGVWCVVCFCVGGWFVRCVCFVCGVRGV